MSRIITFHCDAYPPFRLANLRGVFLCYILNYNRHPSSLCLLSRDRIFFDSHFWSSGRGCIYFSCSRLGSGCRIFSGLVVFLLFLLKIPGVLFPLLTCSFYLLLFSFHFLLEVLLTWYGYVSTRQIHPKDLF